MNYILLYFVEYCLGRQFWRFWWDSEGFDAIRMTPKVSKGFQTFLKDHKYLDDSDDILMIPKNSDNFLNFLDKWSEITQIKGHFLSISDELIQGDHLRETPLLLRYFIYANGIMMKFTGKTIYLLSLVNLVNHCVYTNTTHTVCQRWIKLRGPLDPNVARKMTDCGI